jgi:ribosomal protein S21
MWETRLVHQVKELPHLEQVLRELKRKLKEHGLLELQA